MHCIEPYSLCESVLMISKHIEPQCIVTGLTVHCLASYLVLEQTRREVKGKKKMEVRLQNG